MAQDNAQDKINEGARLSQLRQAPGWAEFIKICEEEYETAFNCLMKGEDEYARGAMRCIENLLGKVQDGVKFGHQMRLKILEKKVHPEKESGTFIY